MVLTKDGIVRLLTEALWGESTLPNFDIYEGVYDIMHNGSENGLSFEALNIERVADDILDRFGILEDDDSAEEMTLYDIERELGKKIRIV